jgi:hypothetical protein
MPEFLSNLNEKSDEELIAIENGKIPYFLSSKSTTTSQDIIIEAKAILHKRRMKQTLWHESLWGKILIGVIIGIIVLILSICANLYLQKYQSQYQSKVHEKMESTKVQK